MLLSPIYAAIIRLYVPSWQLSKRREVLGLGLQGVIFGSRVLEVLGLAAFLDFWGFECFAVRRVWGLVFPG